MKKMKNEKWKNEKITLCVVVNTQSLGAGSEMWIKEKRFNCDRFSFNPTIIILGHDGEKQTKTDEGFDFILLHANFFGL